MKPRQFVQRPVSARAVRFDPSKSPLPEGVHRIETMTRISYELDGASIDPGNWIVRDWRGTHVLTDKVFQHLYEVDPEYITHKPVLTLPFKDMGLLLDVHKVHNDQGAQTVSGTITAALKAYVQILREYPRQKGGDTGPDADEALTAVAQGALAVVRAHRAAQEPEDLMRVLEASRALCELLEAAGYEL